VRGTRIEAVLRSAAGDPVAYRVRGALIALRRGQARWIRIDEGVETGADAEEGLGSSEEVA
jgi:Fe2+ transport system protein FeoA